MSVKLLQGDCLKLMEGVKSHSIDLILADLPYGTTANKWDEVIPIKPLFEQYQRIIKDHGAVLLFGVGKFGAQLIVNAHKKLPYRYDWVWRKTMPVGFLNANKMPLRAHENIYVFYKHLPTYNVQKRYGFKKYSRKAEQIRTGSNYHNQPKSAVSSVDGSRFPIDVIKFSNGNNNAVHPTQKPVALLEYLIKTYTNEGMTVLDNTMGSGSTGVAAVSLNRNFIGMELDEDYFKIAKERIKKADRSKLADC